MFFNIEKNGFKIIAPEQIFLELYRFKPNMNTKEQGRYKKTTRA